MQNLNLTKRALFLLVLSILLINSQVLKGQTKTDPLNLGVIGLTHDHVNWILNRLDRGDIKIVGIVETNLELAQRYSTQYGYSMDIVFNTIEEMVTISKA